MKTFCKNSLVTIALLSGTVAFSAPLSPEAALKRVEPGVRSISPQLVYTLNTPGREAALYVFNCSGGGFMVVSADDTAYALLGYSESGSFDVSNVPPQLAGWLEDYATQIDTARDMEQDLNLGITKTAASAPQALEGLERIEPMLTTKWNQDAPYNRMCPEVIVGNEQFMNCYTGCVATSMAQVVNYFQYPDFGKGVIQYKPETLGTYLTLNFNEKEFDWDNMLYEYKEGEYGAEEVDAVAYLMKACGYAVEMDYYITASGAFTTKIVPALVNYFKYDNGMRFVIRMIYSEEEWARMIYDNLANVGPVIYNGNAAYTGGHSFVCDGYDGNGFFHFNWGWGGMSDGYFTLEALNPGSVGIGGFAGGFNLNQNVILGIRKPDGINHQTQMNVMQEGTVVGSIENENSIHFGSEGLFTSILNYNSYNIKLKLGAIFENIDGESAPVYSEGKVGGETTINIDTYGYYNYSTFNYPLVPIPSELCDGNYKVYLATMQDEFEGAQWLPIEVRHGSKNYVLLTVENGKYKIEDVAPADIIINNAWFDSDLVYGSTSMFHIKLTNTGGVDITRPYYPVFSLDENIVMTGDTKMLTIPANSTLETEWEMGLTRLVPIGMDQSYSMLLWVADADTGALLDSFGFVKIKPAQTDVNFTVGYFEFEGDDMKTGVMDVDGEPKDVFIFPNLNDMTLRITATPDAYFDGELFVTASGAGSSEISTGITEVYRKAYELNKDIRLNTRIKVSYPDAEAGAVYSFRLYSQVNETQTLLAEVFVTMDFEGVVENIPDNLGLVYYYSVTGMPVASPKKGDLVIRMVKGEKPVKVIFWD